VLSSMPKSAKENFHKLWILTNIKMKGPGIRVVNLP